MIQMHYILPVVAIVCSTSAIAQSASDPVALVKQNIELITSADKVLSDVKDATTAKTAVTQLKDLTTKADKLDDAMDKIKLTTEQATAIAKLNGDAQATIDNLVKNCQRIQQANLMTPELLKAIDKFADEANIEAVETVTEIIEETIED